MKADLLHFAGRLVRAAVVGAVSLVVFRVFTASPMVAGNPAAVLATTICCVIAPLAILIGVGEDKGGGDGDDHE